MAGICHVLALGLVDGGVMIRHFEAGGSDNMRPAARLSGMRILNAQVESPVLYTRKLDSGTTTCRSKSESCGMNRVKVVSEQRGRAEAEWRLSLRRERFGNLTIVSQAIPSWQLSTDPLQTAPIFPRDFLKDSEEFAETHLVHPVLWHDPRLAVAIDIVQTGGWCRPT